MGSGKKELSEKTRIYEEGLQTTLEMFPPYGEKEEAYDIFSDLIVYSKR